MKQKKNKKRISLKVRTAVKSGSNIMKSQHQTAMAVIGNLR